MRRRHPLAVVAVVALLALVAGGCAGNDRIVLEATFEDVVDLVPRSMVRTMDVQIGTVDRIELTDDMQAKVTMRVRDDTGLPEDVMAVVRKTQVLGERYIDLVPLSDQGQLSSGTIEETRVVSDLEDLVATGSELLAFVAADQLSAAVHAGATTFGGRGGTLGGLLTDLETFIGRYSAREQDLLRLIDGLDEFLAVTAPEAETHGQALEALARSAAALEEEDERLLDALEDLNRLATVGERIMRDHRQQIDNFWRRFHIILDQVLRIDGALQNVLTWWPRHNLHVRAGVVDEHGQIWADFIFCDTESEDRDNPSATCVPPNPGEKNDPPPFFEGPDECDDRHENCDHPGGAEPNTDRDDGS